MDYLFLIDDLGCSIFFFQFHFQIQPQIYLTVLLEATNFAHELISSGQSGKSSASSGSSAAAATSQPSVGEPLSYFLRSARLHEYSDPVSVCNNYTVNASTVFSVLAEIRRALCQVELAKSELQRRKLLRLPVGVPALAQKAFNPFKSEDDDDDELESSVGLDGGQHLGGAAAGNAANAPSAGGLVAASVSVASMPTRSRKMRTPSNRGYQSHHSNAGSLHNLLSASANSMQLLPQDSSAICILITDGCADMSPSILAEPIRLMRRAGARCFAVQVGSDSGIHPRISFGHIADNESMRYFAAATGGGFIHASDLPVVVPVQSHPASNGSRLGGSPALPGPNFYHQRMMAWELCFSHRVEHRYASFGTPQDRHDMPREHVADSLGSANYFLAVDRGFPWDSSSAPTTPEIVTRYKEYAPAIVLRSVLASRQREGFQVQTVLFSSNDATKTESIIIRMVLFWAYQVVVEYRVKVPIGTRPTHLNPGKINVGSIGADPSRANADEGAASVPGMPQSKPTALSSSGPASATMANSIAAHHHFSSSPESSSQPPPPLRVELDVVSYFHFSMLFVQVHKYQSIKPGTSVILDSVLGLHGLLRSMVDHDAALKIIGQFPHAQYTVDIPPALLLNPKVLDESMDPGGGSGSASVSNSISGNSSGPLTAAATQLVQSRSAGGEETDTEQHAAFKRFWAYVVKLSGKAMSCGGSALFDEENVDLVFRSQTNVMALSAAFPFHLSASLKKRSGAANLVRKFLSHGLCTFVLSPTCFVRFFSVDSKNELNAGGSGPGAADERSRAANMIGFCLIFLMQEFAFVHRLRLLFHNVPRAHRMEFKALLKEGLELLDKSLGGAAHSSQHAQYLGARQMATMILVCQRPMARLLLRTCVPPSVRLQRDLPHDFSMSMLHFSWTWLSDLDHYSVDAVDRNQLAGEYLGGRDDFNIGLDSVPGSPVSAAYDQLYGNRVVDGFVPVVEDASSATLYREYVYPVAEGCVEDDKNSENQASSSVAGNGQGRSPQKGRIVASVYSIKHNSQEGSIATELWIEPGRCGVTNTYPISFLRLLATDILAFCKVFTFRMLELYCVTSRGKVVRHLPRVRFEMLKPEEFATLFDIHVLIRSREEKNLHFALLKGLLFFFFCFRILFLFAAFSSFPARFFFSLLSVRSFGFFPLSYF
jgi:hypothetical protein